LFKNTLFIGYEILTRKETGEKDKATRLVERAFPFYDLLESDFSDALGEG